LNYSETYYLADGFHRIAAAILADFQEFPVEVKQGNKRNAILYSVSCNASHGLRRTNADKRKAVLKLLTDEEWGKWSNREIARQCAVSEFMVRSLRDELSAIKTQMPDRKVIRNGIPYTINTGNIGKSKLPPEQTIINITNEEEDGAGDSR